MNQSVLISIMHSSMIRLMFMLTFCGFLLQTIKTSAKNFPDGVIPVSGAGSYDKPGAVYKLTNDIVNERSAIFLGKDVTLDLNGHTITYAGGDYEHVPNYGFEEGIGEWDVSKAPGAKVVNTAEVHAFIGDKILSLEKGDKIASWGIQSTADDVRVILDSVTIINQGINATAVDVPHATITNCIFKVDNPFIINRHGSQFYAVDLRGTQASEVSYSEFYGGQGNLVIKGLESKIHHNYFVNRQTVTNHYSIMAMGDGSMIFENKFELEMGSFEQEICVAENVEFRSNEFRGIEFEIEATDQHHSYTVSWTLNINSENPGSEIQIFDRNEEKILTQKLNKNGEVNIELPEYSVVGDEKNFFSPYTILAGKKKKTVHLNQNSTINL